MLGGMPSEKHSHDDGFLGQLSCVIRDVFLACNDVVEHLNGNLVCGRQVIGVARGADPPERSEAQ